LCEHTSFVGKIKQKKKPTTDTVHLNQIMVDDKDADKISDLTEDYTVYIGNDFEGELSPTNRTIYTPESERMQLSGYDSRSRSNSISSLGSMQSGNESP